MAMSKDDYESLFIDSMTLKEDKTEKLSITDIETKLSTLEDRIGQLQTELNELIKQKRLLNEKLSELHESERIPSIKLKDPRILSSASSAQKASFMLELFSPRKDIYATREYNREGKTTYYPKCMNFWKDGCYRKDQSKKGLPCHDCPLNEKIPLDSNIIKNGNFLNSNEQGKGAIGIYPLKPGNVTRFIAIDLDEADWRKASRSILVTARDIGIAMAIEKSFSGNGAHLWVFFSEDIPATDARKLAMLLIDRTKERDNTLSITSYDRLFPSQDALSGNGYGNLILMPLVASAVARGCTLFLDDEFKPYPLKEQIPYLSSLPLHSPQDINTFINILNSEEFKLEISSEEKLNPSWSKWIPKISKNDILAPLVIYRSSGISFDKKALSTKAQEALRRIATISNPVYYKELARRDGALFNISSRIPLYEENERVLKLPRALYEVVAKLFKTLHIPYTEEDHRICKTGLEAELNKQLWPYQQEALARTRLADYGIIAAATGSGKTVIAEALIAEKKERTLIIVSSKALLDQWKTSLEENIRINMEMPQTFTGRSRKTTSLIGTLEGSKGNRLRGIIDIATLQSLLSWMEKDGCSIVSRYGLIIVDECHHIAAEKSREALKQLNAKYVYGLSATPKRADGLEKIVYSECGNILFTYKASELAYSRGIAQYFILRFINTPAITNKRGISFTETLNAIAKDERRNVIISDDIETAYSEGRHILILTRRIEQNKALGILLDNKNIPNVVLSSSMKAKDIKAILEQMRGEDISKVLIATDKLLGEGIDIPNLDTLFLASPFMQDGAIQQFAGRLAREHEGKVSTLIYDYVDFTIPRLNYMYAKRLSIYRKLGYVPITDTNKPEAELLFDDISFEDALLQDLGNASSSIIISSSYIVSSKITKTIIDIISSKSLQDIEVLLLFNDKIAEQPAFTALQDKLSRDTIKYRFVESSKNYAVIDNIICWYGDFSLLGQSLRTQQQDERRSMLRIINKEVADCFSNLADYDNLELS